MRLTASLLLAALLASCAGLLPDDPTDAPPPAVDDDWTLVVAADGGVIDGAGLSVADGATHGPTDDLVAVTGALFVAADGTVLICDAIAESFPPQCGGARMAVEGLDLDDVEGLEEANGVRWAEGVTLFGSVE